MDDDDDDDENIAVDGCIPIRSSPSGDDNDGSRCTSSWKDDATT